MRSPSGPASAHRFRAPEAAITNPEEFFFAALALIAVAPVLFGEPAPKSMDDFAPRWLLLFWAGLMTAGAFLVLAGLIGKRLQLELAGLCMVAPPALVYGVAILALNFDTGKQAAALFVGYGISSAVHAWAIARAVQVRREIERASSCEEWGDTGGEAACGTTSP